MQTKEKIKTNASKKYLLMMQPEEKWPPASWLWKLCFWQRKWGEP